MSDYESILTETRSRIDIITLNRSKTPNVLNHKTVGEIGATVTSFDRGSGIGVIIATDSEKAFTADADIKEMAGRSGIEIYVSDWFFGWNVFTSVRIPIITAANGYALDGGCEVVMVTDFIITGSGAKFGQPEVSLGITPGMGGSQHLTRAIDGARVMGMCLTEHVMGTGETEPASLVTRIIEPEALFDETLKVASTITSKSSIATTQIKEQINQAYEMALSQGLLFKHYTFHSLFSSNDQREDMATFTEKHEVNLANS